MSNVIAESWRRKTRRVHQHQSYISWPRYLFIIKLIFVIYIFLLSTTWGSVSIQEGACCLVSIRCGRGCIHAEGRSLYIPLYTFICFLYACINIINVYLHFNIFIYPSFRFMYLDTFVYTFYIAYIFTLRGYTFINSSNVEYR